MPPLPADDDEPFDDDPAPGGAVPAGTDGGTEPDYRWSLANERTLLAYSRTGLALVVAGLAVVGSRQVADPPLWFSFLGLPFLALGGVVAGAGRRRFRLVDHAMRMGHPLPVPPVAALLPAALLAIAAAALVFAAIELATDL